MICSKLEHPSKTLKPISVTDEGIVKSFNEVHPSNKDDDKYSIGDSIITFSKHLHLLKHPVPIFVAFGGIVTLINELQPRKANEPIDFKDEGKFI